MLKDFFSRPILEKTVNNFIRKDESQKEVSGEVEQPNKISNFNGNTKVFNQTFSLPFYLTKDGLRTLFNEFVVQSDTPQIISTPELNFIDRLLSI